MVNKLVSVVSVILFLFNYFSAPNSVAVLSFHTNFLTVILGKATFQSSKSTLHDQTEDF